MAKFTQKYVSLITFHIKQLSSPSTSIYFFEHPYINVTLRLCLRCATTTLRLSNFLPVVSSDVQLSHQTVRASHGDTLLCPYPADGCIHPVPQCPVARLVETTVCRVWACLTAGPTTQKPPSTTTTSRVTTTTTIRTTTSGGDDESPWGYFFLGCGLMALLGYFVSLNTIMFYSVMFT